MSFRITSKEFRSILFLEKSGLALGRRLAEICKQLVTDKDFKRFIIKQRKYLHIPKEGFDFDQDKKSKELNRLKAQEILSVYIDTTGSITVKKVGKDIDKFFNQDRYKNFTSFFNGIFSKYFNRFIRGYILYGEFNKSAIDIATVDTNYSIEGYADDIWQTVVIELSPYATKDDAIDFIKRNWPEIKCIQENMLYQNGKIKPRNKSKKNFFRDLYIMDLFDSIKDKGKYPELYVAKVLKNEHKIILSEGTIRSIVSRVRKFVANGSI